MASLNSLRSLALTLPLFVAIVLTAGQQDPNSCDRVPPIISSRALRTPGDNGYRIIVSGNPEQYVPGEVYIVSLKGWRTQLSVQKFIAFTLTVEASTPGQEGVFVLYDDSLTQWTPGCRNSVSQASLNYKSEIQVRWTAPPPGSGCVKFKALLVENRDSWYKDDGGLSKELCEEETENFDDQPKILTDCCACDEAKYEVVFDGIWSKETHPKDFPTNEWLLHFSDIIGASHTPKYTMWDYGLFASEGLQYVAEWGSTRNMETELKAQSEHIRTIIKARGLWYPNVNGKTSAVFRVDKKHHLMSLVSMLGPSPDWVVGVSQLELCLANCSWVGNLVLNLYPWDAGTDSGITYQSPNLPTYPREKITRITSSFPADERAPFYDATGAPMPPVAQLTVTRQRLYEKSCHDEALIAEAGGETNAEPETSEDSRPECATSDWSEFTPCSVTCAKGLRSRSRTYLMPMKADMMGCNAILMQKEMCAAEVPVCDDDESSEELQGTMMAKRCAVTDWTDWSECSVTCGKGTRVRTRSYIDPMAQKICTLATRDTEMCMAGTAECETEQINSQCAVTAWSDWSPCSVTCGKGIKFRIRRYLNPGAESFCNVDMMQKLPCMADKPDCFVPPDEAKEICMLERMVGPCRGYFPRWYFDTTKRMCLQFIYGGCRGNRNNFERYEDCNEMCQMLRSDYRPSLPSVRSVPEHLSEPRSEPRTDLRRDPHIESRHPSHSTHEYKTESRPDVRSEPLPEVRPEPAVDCMFTDWTDWSTCSATCGKGRMERRRMIKVYPRNGGKPCPKKLIQRKKCNLPPCPRPFTTRLREE